MQRRRTTVVAAVALALGTLVAGAAPSPGVVEKSRSGHTFPDVIHLPDGFQPEGIARGGGTSFYVGSLVDGRIYRGNLRTGTGDNGIDPVGSVVGPSHMDDPRIDADARQSHQRVLQKILETSCSQ